MIRSRPLIRRDHQESDHWSDH